MTDILDRGHSRFDTHAGPAPVDPSAGDQGLGDTQVPPVASSNSHDCGAKPGPTPNRDTPRSREFAELRLLAESFEDAQKARIAIENRLRSGTDSAPVAEALAALEHAEKKLGLAMRRSFRKAAPEANQWVKDTPGVGEHLVARLLGCIGHPVIASPYHWEGEGHDRALVADAPFSRSVSQLWSYCGHGDAGRKKRKGMTADEAMALGNPRAKMLVHLIAEGAMKCVGSASRAATPEVCPPPDTDLSGDLCRNETHTTRVPADHSENGDGSNEDSTPSGPSARRRSPYRDVYDLARITYADRVDANGKPWTPAHQHNAALRLVGKVILRDLWLAAQ